MDLWVTPDSYFYFVINTFYVAVIILSERALSYVFLLSNIFMEATNLFVVVYRLLGSGTLITGLHS